MHRTPDQRMAELQWEAACERLRNALRAPPDRPTDEILSRDEALEVVRKGLNALRKAYGHDAAAAESDLRGTAMREGFRNVCSILKLLAAQSPAEQASAVYTHNRGAPYATQRDFDQLVALYEYGFVQATDSSDAGKRELRAPTLTADGRDLLDALQNTATWAQVERMASTQGQTLSLGTVKAAVAAALTGGFNS